MVGVKDNLCRRLDRLTLDEDMSRNDSICRPEKTTVEGVQGV